MNVTSTARWTHAAPLIAANVELLHAPPISPSESRTDFVDRGLRQSLTTRRGPVFLLLDEEFRDMSIDSARTEFVQEPFTVNERGQRVGLMSATRERSVHEVRFGQLVVQAPDRRERVELVAVKPVDNIARAVNEFRAMQVVNGIETPEERPRGFQQLGFYRDNGDTYLLSRYEHSVLTLDAMLWDETFTPTDRLIRAAMGHCAVFLGDLHASGMMHGDVQAKNIAADNKGPRVIDLEKAQKPNRIVGGLNPMAAREMITHDLRRALGEFERWQDMLGQWFINPYVSIVGADGTALPEMAIPTETEIKQMLTLEPYLR